MFRPKTSPVNCKGNKNLLLPQTEECDLVVHYHTQVTADLKRPQCNSAVWQIVYHKYLTAGWLLGLFLLRSIRIVSMFGSRTSKFSWSPAKLAVTMFCVFSAVSFADRFIPALTFNKSLHSGSTRDQLVCLGNKPVRSILCYFDIASIFTTPLSTFPVRPSVG